MMSKASESPLQAKLYGAGPVGIKRVQERSARHAIRTAVRLKAGGIYGTGVTTDDVVSGASRIIGIVDSELGVVENIEKFRAQLDLARLGDLEVLQQRHVEVQAAGIIQEVAAGIAKSQSPRSYEN